MDEIRIAKTQLRDALRIVEAIEADPRTLDGLRESAALPHLNTALAYLGGCFDNAERWWPPDLERPKIESQRSARF
jgi:hypothetical protein